MVRRVYRWRGAYWLVRCRWAKNARPRNVLLERVEPVVHRGGLGAALADPAGTLRRSEGRWWRLTGELTVRPFRGLRRLAPTTTKE